MLKRVMDAVRERLTEVNPETFGFIRDLHDNGNIVTVTFGGIEGRYMSAVIDFDRRGFTIDTPVPDIAPGRLRRVKKVRIDAKLGGVGLQMIAAVRRIGEDDGEPRIELQFPEKLAFNQRRKHRRVRPRWPDETEVQFINHDRQRFEGLLHDLSPDGMAALLPGVPDGILPGQVLPFCQVRLPGGRSIGPEVEVRYVQRERRSGKTKVGVLFVALTRQDRRNLVNALTEMARKR